ncbi:DUF6950 family protein [Sphingobium rhizovicinum]|uniref:DUF6950 family protein n=1 Tax=Sphingobium rhizovicinum TaxID=432308 RepID=A0ABV7NK63_9SPHN
MSDDFSYEHWGPGALDPVPPAQRIDLVRRAEATRLTLAKYRSRPFSWADRATCIHLARHHLRNMGHKPPSIPDFRSALGAQKALLRQGHDDLHDLLDSLLPRIAPAQMLVGDLALIDGDGPFDSICVSAGGKLLGWHEDDASGIKPLLALTVPLGAWRV